MNGSERQKRVSIDGDSFYKVKLYINCHVNFHFLSLFWMIDLPAADLKDKIELNHGFDNQSILCFLLIIEILLEQVVDIIKKPYHDIHVSLSS